MTHSGDPTSLWWRPVDGERPATLVEFLKARYAEEEQAWQQPGPLASLAPLMLEDIMAKRAIINWCTDREQIWVGTVGSDPTDPKNYVPGHLSHRTDTPVLRLLAVPYRKHPDYQQGWA